MTCKRCGKEDVITISAKCDDRCCVQYPDGKESNDYVPRELGIGGGDYVEFDFCLDRGSIPRRPTK